MKFLFHRKWYLEFSLFLLSFYMGILILNYYEKQLITSIYRIAINKTTQFFK